MRSKSPAASLTSLWNSVYFLFCCLYFYSRTNSWVRQPRDYPSPYIVWPKTLLTAMVMNVWRESLREHQSYLLVNRVWFKRISQPRDHQRWGPVRTRSAQTLSFQQDSEQNNLGVAGLLRALLGIVDYFSGYVSVEECSAGGTRARFNTDNSEKHSDPPASSWLIFHLRCIKHDSGQSFSCKAQDQKYMMWETLSHNISRHVDVRTRGRKVGPTLNPRTPVDFCLYDDIGQGH